MARGWESKSVESQVESFTERRRPVAPGPSPEQLALDRKRDGILLQHKRVSLQIESCTDDRYRKTLSDGLAFLETQIAEVDHQLLKTKKATA